MDGRGNRDWLPLVKILGFLAVEPLGEQALRWLSRQLR